jgi:hypothetical protein
MKFLKVYLFALSFIFLSCDNAVASIGIAAPECSFVGKVTDVSIRKEPGSGMSEGQTFTYIDVTVDVVNGMEKERHNGMLGCDIPSGSVKVFQMRRTLMGKYSRSVPKVGSCIKASAQVMADGNFMSGNWLTVNEKLPKTSCSSDEN